MQPMPVNTHDTELVVLERKSSSKKLFPVYREWDLFSDLVSEEPVTMEFRLTYQGVLHSTGNKSATGHTHQIRRYFHKQLANLWRTDPILRMVAGKIQGAVSNIKTPQGFMTLDIGNLAEVYERAGRYFIPLVCEENSLTCSLDILLLRRDLNTILVSGDLDGRIKTLIDALTVPNKGLEKKQFDGDEAPMYCLMSDDKLISEVKVTADHLFADPEQVIEQPRVTPSGEPAINPNHVMAIVNVKTRGEVNLWS